MAYHGYQKTFYDPLRRCERSRTVITHIDDDPGVPGEFQPEEVYGYLNMGSWDAATQRALSGVLSATPRLQWPYQWSDEPPIRLK